MPFGRRTLVVAAHPDDETIGAGALLRTLPSAIVLHVTTGAPDDERLVPELYRGAADYAAVRRREALAALALAGLAPERVRAWDYIDQRAVYSLPALARQLAGLYAQWQPQLVITHPYEGGHPDHDSCAFAAHAAAALAGRDREPPLLVEMTSYHAPGGVWVTGEFLTDDGPIWDLELTARESARKRAMLAAYASQADVLVAFGTSRERFRPAPPYDFSRPPHAPPVLYDSMGLSLTSRELSALTVEASDELGLQGQLGVGT